MPLFRPALANDARSPGPRPPGPGQSWDPPPVISPWLPATAPAPHTGPARSTRGTHRTTRRLVPQYAHRTGKYAAIVDDTPPNFTKRPRDPQHANPRPATHRQYHPDANQPRQHAYPAPDTPTRTRTRPPAPRHAELARRHATPDTADRVRPPRSDRTGSTPPSDWPVRLVRTPRPPPSAYARATRLSARQRRRRSVMSGAFPHPDRQTHAGLLGARRSCPATTATAYDAPRRPVSATPSPTPVTATA
jgi:hypothetical protein